MGKGRGKKDKTKIVDLKKTYSKKKKFAYFFSAQ